MLQHRLLLHSARWADSWVAACSVASAASPRPTSCSAQFGWQRSRLTWLPWVQESKAAAAMSERIMADVQRSNNEVASLNAYLQVRDSTTALVAASLSQGSRAAHVPQLTFRNLSIASRLLRVIGRLSVSEHAARCLPQHPRCTCPAGGAGVCTQGTPGSTGVCRSIRAAGTSNRGTDHTQTDQHCITCITLHALTMSAGPRSEACCAQQ
jgi:hypothetical protein